MERDGESGQERDRDGWGERGMVISIQKKKWSIEEEWERIKDYTQEIWARKRSHHSEFPYKRLHSTTIWASFCSLSIVFSLSSPPPFSNLSLFSLHFFLLAFVISRIYIFDGFYFYSLIYLYDAASFFIDWRSILLSRSLSRYIYTYKSSEN